MTLKSFLRYTQTQKERQTAARNFALHVNAKNKWFTYFFSDNTFIHHLKTLANLWLLWQSLNWSLPRFSSTPVLLRSQILCYRKQAYKRIRAFSNLKSVLLMTMANLSFNWPSAQSVWFLAPLSLLKITSSFINALAMFFYAIKCEGTSKISKNITFKIRISWQWWIIKCWDLI